MKNEKRQSCLLPYSDALLLDTILHNPELYYEETLQTLELDGVFLASDGDFQLVRVMVDEDQISVDGEKGTEDEDRNDLYEHVAELLSRHLGHRVRYYLTMLEGALLCILSYHYTAIMDPALLKQKLLAFSEESLEQLGAPVVIHVGEPVHGAAQLFNASDHLSHFHLHTEFMELQGSLFMQSDFNFCQHINLALLSAIHSGAIDLLNQCNRDPAHIDRAVKETFARLTDNTFYHKESLYAIFLLMMQSLLERIRQENAYAASPQVQRSVDLFLERIAEAYTISQEYAIFSEFLREAAAAMHVDPKQRLITQMLAFIDGHYTDPNLDVSMLAERYGLRQSTLSASFHRVTGESLSGYICRQRLEEAKRCLMDPEVTIDQAAARSGFGSTVSLFRAFRNVLQTTPGEYRARAAGSAEQTQPGQEPGS